MTTAQTAPIEPQTTTLELPAALRHIVLTGFMGAGKSTIGRLLALRLGWNFLDLDHHLEARAGLSVPEIFARHGEPHFRRLESSAPWPPRSANPIPSSPSAEALPRSSRIASSSSRPPAPSPSSSTPRSLPSSTAASSRSSHAPCWQTRPPRRYASWRRHPIYRRLARHTIDTSSSEPAGTVEAVLATLTLTTSRPR